jgi:hypothetical protein
LWGGDTAGKKWGYGLKKSEGKIADIETSTGI